MKQAQTNDPQELTPKHVRAARALLAWSQQELAKQANVATSTVADFERGHRTPVANNAQAIRGTLEQAGIHFLPNGAVIGPPTPKFPAPESPGTPVRWVNATDLANWAERLDGIATLPNLLSKLIRATLGRVDVLRFPSDEGTQYSGWDGRTSTERGSNYVPAGEAGWEIGTQRNNITKKANDDYGKRTREPAPLTPAQSTFVFVTPRHWPDKDKWAQAQKEKSEWKDVRAYDGDDLVHWLELCPAVGLWLATHIGKLPPGVRQLDEMWEEWSFATQLPLTAELILSDRDDDAMEVLKWLRSEPSILSIQATTTEEAAAFFHAAIQMLPPDNAEQYLFRSVVAVTQEAARTLAASSPPLIIVMLDPNPGLARSIAEKGHFVLLVYDGQPTAPGNVRKLPRPSQEGIKAALVSAGITEERAYALARESGRNLAILRRLMPTAPGSLPDWAQATPSPALLAALLACSWDEEGQNDRAILEKLSDMPYEQFARALAPYVGEFDSPLRKIGNTWRMASPQDAWMLLARFLTAADITRFEEIALSVLGAADPRFELDPNVRWFAQIKGIHPEFSGLLRHGIGEVLILLAVHGSQINTAPFPARHADAIVRKLLHNADRQRWWSLSRSFQLLAEAAPSTFLDAVEAGLTLPEQPIKSLFEAGEDAIFSGEYLSDLLWALETLAWSPDYMPRVSFLLARLDKMDPGGQYANRPANSLRVIHLLWAPQTYVPLDRRLQVLDHIRRSENDASWKLMLGILPSGHDSFSPSPIPRWRDFTVGKVEEVTYRLIGRGVEEISKRLLEDVGTDVGRWKDILDRLSNISTDHMSVIGQLSQATTTISDLELRDELRNHLRKLLHHHRQIPDAGWALPSEELRQLELIYENLTPNDIVKEIAWLFDMSVSLPNPSNEGWQEQQNEIDDHRRTAIKTVYAALGVDGVFNLARSIETAGFVGKALVEIDIGREVIDGALERALRSENVRERNLAHGMIVTLFQKLKEPWAEEIIARALKEAWGEAALLTIFLALPQNAWAWDLVSATDEKLEEAYWKKAPLHWLNSDDDFAFAINKLLAAGRAHDAISLASRSKDADIPSDLIVQALTQAAQQKPSDASELREPAMFQYYVEKLFERLDSAPGVSEDILLKLEWMYLPLFEHSKRPAKALLKALAHQPELFIDMIKAIYKPDEDSGIVEEEPSNPVQHKAIANQAYRLLDLWNRVPGTSDDGIIDADALIDWISAARDLASNAGRGEIADIKIGNILSASPVGADDIWPAEPVRSAIEHFKSETIERGFAVGKMNRRGVTSRGPRDGGQLERAEAAKYRRYAEALAYESMRTSKALLHLAEHYDHEALRHDEDAERLDWRA